MQIMSRGFVCNHLVLVHAELDRKGYVNMVIGIKEDKYLGFISEKKTPQCVQWFNFIYNSGN